MSRILILVDEEPILNAAEHVSRLEQIPRQIPDLASQRPELSAEPGGRK